MRAIITSKFQTTIPKAVRENLKLYAAPQYKIKERKSLIMRKL